MKTLLTTTKKRVFRTLILSLLIAVGFLCTQSIYAQEEGQTITGLVSSQDGPVLGAAIVLKGTRVGVISNENGEFTFPQKLHENDILVVSFFGYKTQEITISENSTFITPFLEDEPIIVVAALRMEDPELLPLDEQN